MEREIVNRRKIKYAEIKKLRIRSIRRAALRSRIIDPRSKKADWP